MTEILSPFSWGRLGQPDTAFCPLPASQPLDRSREHSRPARCTLWRQLITVHSTPLPPDLAKSPQIALPKPKAATKANASPATQSSSLNELLSVSGSGLANAATTASGATAVHSLAGLAAPSAAQPAPLPSGNAADPSPAHK